MWAGGCSRGSGRRWAIGGFDGYEVFVPLDGAGSG